MVRLSASDASEVQSGLIPGRGGCFYSTSSTAADMAAPSGRARQLQSSALVNHMEAPWPHHDSPAILREPLRQYRVTVWLPLEYDVNSCTDSRHSVGGVQKLRSILASGTQAPAQTGTARTQLRERAVNLATTYSRGTCRPTTIGAAAFHFRVRDGNGWFHRAMVTRGRAGGVDG